jgi:hypothetical protein
MKFFSFTKSPESTYQLIFIEIEKQKKKTAQAKPYLDSGKAGFKTTFRSWIYAANVLLGEKTY